MSVNNELDKFKGDGTQDVNAWFTNYEQWANVHDLHYLKTTPLLAVKEHPLTCSLYILNVLANHQLQVIKVPHLYPLPNQLVFELIFDHKFTPSQCRINKFKKKMARDQFRSSWYDLSTDGRFNIHCAVCMFGCPETQLSCAGAQAV